MIDEGTLLEFSNRFRDVRHLEKDYLLTLILFEISSQFAREVIFKGGTALKFFYGLNRFSEDLDFSYLGGNDTAGRNKLAKKMEAVLNHVNLQYEVVGREHRGNKVGGKVVGINYEVRIKGPLNQKSKQLQNINVDFSTRDDVVRKEELKYITPFYQDLVTFSIPVMQLEEIVAEKVAAILERDKMRDIYDLHYLLSVRGAKFDTDLVREKLRLRGSKYEPDTLRVKVEGVRNSTWRSELAYLVQPLVDSSKAVSELLAILPP